MIITMRLRLTAALGQTLDGQRHGPSWAEELALRLSARLTRLDAERGSRRR